MGFAPRPPKGTILRRSEYRTGLPARFPPSSFPKRSNLQRQPRIGRPRRQLRCINPKVTRMAAFSGVRALAPPVDVSRLPQPGPKPIDDDQREGAFLPPPPPHGTKIAPRVFRSGTGMTAINAAARRPGRLGAWTGQTWTGQTTEGQMDGTYPRHSAKARRAAPWSGGPCARSGLRHHGQGG